jgi:hypothetical protein
MTHEVRLTATGGLWWAAYDEGARQFVVPVMSFDAAGRPYVWSAESHAPVPAVRTSFVGLVSDAYRGEYGPAIAEAIKGASGGHRGETVPDSASGGHDGQIRESLRDGVEKARDAIHDATAR